jgi:DNA-binding MarR family transcriptional regulator
MDDRLSGAPSTPLDLESKVAERPADHAAELRLWLRLLTCTNLIEAGIRRQLRERFDMTLPRFDLMAQLDKARDGERDGMTAGELSRRMMVSNGNITAIVDALVTQGYVDRRAADADRRQQVVSLTLAGRRAFRAMAAEHGDWIGAAFAGLSAAETEQLMALLAKAKASARRALGDES